VVKQSYTYSSFGKIESQLDPNFIQPYSFTSREFDPETALYFYRARYYDPATGRFLQEDPIGFGGGDVNLYRYVANNPVNFVDPAGLVRHGDPRNPPPNVHTRCRWPQDSCKTIKAKIWLLERLIKSTEGWDQHMPPPRGGTRHQTEIEQFKKQLAECQNLYNKHCCSPDKSPEPFPIPLPSPTPTPKPNMPIPFWWTPPIPNPERN